MARRTEQALFDTKARRIGMPKDYDFRFRRRWFWNRNARTFTKHVAPRFSGQPAKFLDIGILEAMQEVWLLENVLTHPQSHVVCVDPWVEHFKLSQQWMDEAFANAKHNLMPYAGKYQIVRGYSRYILGGFRCWPDNQNGISELGTVMPRLLPHSFDCAIIDGDHRADAVERDAVLCLPLVKRGGWILFDDVRNRITKTDHVADGIERFLVKHGSQVRLAWRHNFMDCYEVV